MDNMRVQIDYLKDHMEDEFNQVAFMKFRFFPWAKDTRTWKRVITNDMFGENILKTRIEGEGHTSRYFIKGKNIIKYLNKYGSLKMSEIRNPNKWKLPRKKKLKSSEKKWPEQSKQSRQ